MNKKTKKGLAEVVKEVMAGNLGIEPEDIEDSDTLAGDLHMKPSDISDLITHLEAQGIKTSDLDLSEIETVDELIEELESQKEI